MFPMSGRGFGPGGHGRVDDGGRRNLEMTKYMAAQLGIPISAAWPKCAKGRDCGGNMADVAREAEERCVGN